MVRRRFKRFNQRGFTLIEVLFSLSICLLITINTASILNVILSKDKLEVITQSYHQGINQLTKILYTAKNIEVSNQLTYSNNQNEKCTISLNNHRVVKEPGFDILIHDVDDLNFFKRDKNIYIELTNKENTYTFLVATDYQISEEISDEENSLSNE